MSLFVYYGEITYAELKQDLCGRTPAELAMAVQAVFMDEVGEVRGLRYVWAEDGSLLLALDCALSGTSEVMTFSRLARELNALCWWQLRHRVMIGLRHAVADVVTLYHAFEFAQGRDNTLMLVSTPPDEYFEALAA